MTKVTRIESDFEAKARKILGNIKVLNISGHWSEVDAGSLGIALEALNHLHQQETLNVEKAYGGCHNCYGKGYSTWRHGETHRGSTHNMRNEVKYCDCDRGKQLAELRTNLSNREDK